MIVSNLSKYILVKLSNGLAHLPSSATQGSANMQCSKNAL